MDSEQPVGDFDISDVLRHRWNTWMESDHTLSGDAMAFVGAINWTEPFILSVIIFHMLLVVAVICSRRSSTAHQVLFVLIACLVFSLKYINGFFRKHWNTIATQNYFDESGLFVSVTFALPLLVLAVYILMCMLFSASQLVVSVKRQELRNKAKVEAKKNRKAD
eukprot:GDKH01003642.1.p1 GENE.GDKH01003642.1~~GDKH01003642.1.p1  ORF type:complete len:164 (+),score=10.73 GDKH01003642.1:168-659(+)